MKMLLSVLLAVIIILTASMCMAQWKDELKKKYETSDIQKELQKKMQTDNIYPDSIILAPLHYTNSVYSLNETVKDFNSISIDVEILDILPDNYNLYISTFNLALNGMPLYCGIQSKSDGKNIVTKKSEDFRYGGIFSRWMERNANALRTKGYYASSDAEGDFISVRNKVGWGKGTYRITLKKDGYVPGKPVGDSIIPKDLYFSWGDLEQSWVTMTVEDLATHRIVTIGSLAFPGKYLSMSKSFTSFAEQYKYYIDFAAVPRFIEEPSFIYYKNLPHIRFIQKNLCVNGIAVHPKEVVTYHNRTHHPEQSKIPAKMPILSKATYNKETGELYIETGIFEGWPH